ncbi:FHA domain-containing protein [Flexivirga sp. ID2601S]|uniref:FHA domain-containing protein n=1 Tax=Flexivirga aerilata TaxID=1656889 RepID=A0A849ALE2_9MICO|nr:FHA domain-containing protein [Flexivirga aerilata]NNG40903.1 FHA domain-containing protein [Flexivirga aerilata]
MTNEEGQFGAAGDGNAGQPAPDERDYAGGDATTARIPAVGEPAAPERVSQSEVRLSASDQATIDALRPGTALLLVLRGPNSGARFLLDDAEVSSGRHPDSDIFLDDVTVSRRHAVFRRTDTGYAVTDVGSLNGTYVNGQLVDSRDLQTGDEVMVGKFRLVFYGAGTSGS